MLLRVANDGNANAEQPRELTLRDSVGGVVGALGMNLGLQFSQQRVDVEFVEDDHVVHRHKCRHERCPRSFGENWAPVTFKLSGAGVRIDSNYQQVAFGARGLYVTDVSGVEQI